METKTLWSLPAQPLPDIELPRAVSVTVWFFCCIGFSVLFWKLFQKRPKSPWSGFKNIMIGTFVLVFWYFFAVVDRWIHYDRRFAPLGYIIAGAVWEFSRVGSAILLLWGTYMVVWKELEPRFSETSAGYWWLAAQISIFVVGLVSFFYVVLRLAMAIVWMQFLSLNIIGDIATKKRNFEIATAVFLTIFGFFTFLAATATILFRAKRTEGRVSKNRLYLLLGTVFLLVRSIVEIGTTAADDQKGTELAQDISYGLITCLFLAMMSAMGWMTSSKDDSVDMHETKRIIEADIRKNIIEQLKEITNDARSQSPPFAEVLQQTRDKNLPSIIDVALQHMDGDRDKMDELATDIANNYLNRLQSEFGELDPKKGKDFAWRSESTLAFVGRMSGAGRRSRVSSQGSDASLKNTLNRTKRSGQSLRPSGGSRGFTPPAAGTDAASNLAPVMEPQEGGDNFDIRSTYTMSTIGVRPEAGRRNVTDPIPRAASRLPVGPSFAARRHASSPAPSVAAQSWIHEMGDNTPGGTPVAQVRQLDPSFHPPSATTANTQPFYAPNASRFGSQPAQSSPLTHTSTPPTQQQIEMRFGRATPTQQRNRPIYGELGMDIQSRGPVMRQED